MSTTKLLNLDDYREAVLRPMEPRQVAAPRPVATPAIDQCGGTGWVRYDVPYGDPNFGRLRPCPDCRIGDERLIERCTRFSLIDWQTDEPPTLRGFHPHDAAAQRMLEAATAFVKQPDGWLTIHGHGTGDRTEPGAGHWGAGKSHLAEAIARSLLRRRVPAVYHTLDQLCQYAGACWRDEDIDYDARKRWLSEVPVLIVDEVNKESESLATWRIRFDILNARYQAAIRGTGGATVLISNDTPTAWRDPAIASRVMDARFVQVAATKVDYRRFVAGQSGEVS